MIRDTACSDVPHLLHYCWFGEAPLPTFAKRSLSSWSEFAPGFEIHRWDETNAPLDECSFICDAYTARKWAFVADYVRFWVLYHCGGVYMDVGSELVRDITPLMSDAPFSAIEAITRTVNPGFVICSPSHNEIIGEVLDNYKSLVFEDTSEFLRAHTVNEMLTQVLEGYGFIRSDKTQKIVNWTILSSDYFDPLYGFGGFHLTKHTYSIHRSSASWLDPVQRTKQKVQLRVTPFLGHRLGQITGRVIGELAHNGVRGIGNLFDVTKDVIHRKEERR